jgi:murein L,D-transpeptidase YcbB/YkuD
MATPPRRQLYSHAATDVSVSRRALLAGAAGLWLGVVDAASAQSAEANWWERLQGFGTTDSNAKKVAARPAAEQEQLNDLRKGNVPWRSDTMLEALDGAIARYEKIAQRGGWPQVPVGRTLRLDDADDRVIAVRRRLAATGELSGTASSYGFGGANSSLLDERVEAALRQFQDTHVLRLTGRADRPTVESMNITVAARIEQLKLNRRRIQELLQARVEDRYVLVNAAAFQLEAVEQHEVRQRHRVIVGKPDRQTPQIKATIKALNFFPYWRVPDSVASLDLIPRLRKEPEYLQKEQIRVLNGVNGPVLDPTNIDWNTADAKVLKFRQEPGQQNALGLVRIDMPNPDIVYMHDTPLKPLFGQRSRAFSAGCVRVQDVFKLVEWIARHEVGWDQAGRVSDVIAAGQPLDMNLTRPIPVYFTYITAWAEADGRVIFQPDVYGRDGVPGGASDKDPESPPLPPGGLAP